jgi:hypothetical protein
MLAQYYIDEGDSLRARKEPVQRLLSAWEGRPISFQEFTLCPSGATAPLVVLAMLRSLGVSLVLFETPCYFATVEQAMQIRLRFDLLPTYHRQDYELPDLGASLRKGAALWLTQPRASLGFNQPFRVVQTLLKQVGSDGYLVIDEATDRTQLYRNSRWAAHTADSGMITSFIIRNL